MIKKIIVAGVLAACMTASAWAAVGGNLSDVIAYPNPCKAALGHTAITFDNLTPAVRLRIYKKTGELIADKDVSSASGSFAWNLTNDDGYPVATGIYLYLITNSNGQQAKGKIAIIK